MYEVMWTVLEWMELPEDREPARLYLVREGFYF